MSSAFPEGLIGPGILRHCTLLVGEVLRFQMPADVTVSKHFRDNRELGARDRAWIAETVFAVLREKSLLSHLAQSMTGDLNRRLVLLALARHAGLAALERATDEEERQALERLLALDTAQMPRDVRLNLPDWILAALDAQWGAERVDGLMQSLNQPAPLDLRVNSIKSSRETVLGELTKIGMPGVATALSPWGIRLEHKPSINLSRLFTEGAVEVQDEGSQLLALLVGAKRGEMVADFCAGAGGKTLALGAMMRGAGRLYAFDISAKRLDKLKPRLARSGLSNVVTIALDSDNDVRLKRLAGKLDRVLVDAPCSGLGTLRRNPDLKWNQAPKDIDELSGKQTAILNNAARLLKPGGRLVYATCSVLAAENDAIADSFVAAHPEFTERNAGELLGIEALGPMARLNVLTDQHGTDSFFAAVFERNK
jgi:16S rRNA (cytosine967-C5)-methyltransferase